MIRYKGLFLASAVIAGATLVAAAGNKPKGASFEFKTLNRQEVLRNLPARIVVPDRHADGGMREVDERTTFYNHERFRIELQPAQSGHLYVFCRTSQGSFQLLYPKREDGDNYVSRDSDVSLPDNGWFRFDEEPGQEELILLQSQTPLVDIEQPIEEGHEVDSFTLAKYDQFITDAPQNVIVRRIVLQHEAR